MAKGKPTAETIRIRAMVKVERLKGKLANAIESEAQRRAKYEIRMDAMRAELEKLENGGLTDEVSP